MSKNINIPGRTPKTPVTVSDPGHLLARVGLSERRVELRLAQQLAGATLRAHVKCNAEVDVDGVRVKLVYSLSEDYAKALGMEVHSCAVFADVTGCDDSGL